MGVGRVLCVSLPFGLTVASLICLLIVTLAGVTDKNLDMFKVNTQNFSVSSSDLQNFENFVKRDELLFPRHFSELTTAALANAAVGPSRHFSDLTTAALANAASQASSSSSNITAAELGLADTYKIALWNFCATTGSKTNCSKAKFNWAHSELNVANLSSLVSSTGANVTLPKSLRDSLKTYATVAKWTEVVYIIALVASVLELVVGLFGFCSRMGSCCTFIVSGFSTAAVVIASIMATATASVVVGAIDSTTKAYGVKASLDTSFLIITWLAAAFSIGSGLFWLLSICCCASDNHRSNRRSRDDGEKLLPNRGSGYQPVEDPHGFNANTAYGPQTQGVFGHQKPSREGAYEPYSHGAV